MAFRRSQGYKRYLQPDSEENIPRTSQKRASIQAPVDPNASGSASQQQGESVEPPPPPENPEDDLSLSGNGNDSDLSSPEAPSHDDDELFDDSVNDSDDDNNDDDNNDDDDNDDENDGGGGDGGGDDDGGDDGGDDGNDGEDRDFHHRDITDKYNLDGIVTPNVTLTKFEILILILHFTIRFSLSNVGVKALIELINVVLGTQVFQPSNYLFNKVFKSGKNVNYHLYCSNCLLYLGKKEDCTLDSCTACNEPIDRNSLNKNHFYVNVSLADQIREKLEGPGGEELLSYSRNRSKDDNIISDVFDGLLFAEQKNVNPEGAFLTLNMNTDGAPVFKNSSSAMWPVQFYLNEIPPEERFAPYNVLLSGLWFGRPDLSLVTYLSFLVNELQELANEGIRWLRSSTNTYETTKVFVLNFVVDTVAKAKLLSMIQFNGYKSCYFCQHPGDPLERNQINQVRYGFREDYPSRSGASIKRDMQIAQETGEVTNGMKGISPLYYFPLFSLPHGVTIDYMHSHLLGVTRQLCVNIWTATEFRDQEFYLSKQQQNLIDKRIRLLQPPSIISRDARPFTSCSLWKANEWRSWLFYYGPICLKGVLVERYYRHFCLLSAAIFFFSQTRIDRAQIVMFGDYLTLFVKNFQNYYGLAQMVPNVHLSEHIKECVIANGPLWAYSAFPFETGNSYLVKLVKGAKEVAQQIVNKYCTYSSIPKVVALHPPLKEEVVTFCDSVLSLRRFKFGERTAENVVIVGRKFRKSFSPSAEEIHALRQALPEADPNDLFLITKVIFRRYVLTAACKKKSKKDDSYVLLEDGTPLKILKFFVSSVDDYSKVYVFGRKIKLEESGIGIFNIPNHHIKLCQPAPFADSISVLPVDKIVEQCFFMDVFENSPSLLSPFPNHIERD